MAADLRVAASAGIVLLSAALLLLAAPRIAVLRRRPARPPRSLEAASAEGRSRYGTQLRAASALCLVVTGAVTLATAARVASLAAAPLSELARDRAGVRATVVATADPVPISGTAGAAGRGQTLLLRARVKTLRARGVVVTARSPILLFATAPEFRGVLPGTGIEVTGRLGPPRRGDSVAAVLAVSGGWRPVSRPDPLNRAAGRLRAGLRQAVSGLPPDERGLVPGLVVGDVSEVPPGLVEDFRTAGLTHLTAVSGANVAIVLAFVLLSARWAGARGRFLPGIGLAALGGFLVLARPEPSVLRASAMGTVAVAALGSGRHALGMPALCGSIVGLLLLDPWLSRSYGFGLSVVATASLLLLARRWSTWLEFALPRRLAAALAVPLVAQVACAPVLVLLSPQVSLAAVPANLLAEPAVAPATILGLLAVCFAPVSPDAAGIAGRLSGLPAWWIVHVAHAAARLPLAVEPWPGGISGALGLFATLAAVVACANLLVRRSSWPLAAAVAALACSAMVTGAALRHRSWPPPGWVLVACDVGQGDGLVLASGPGTAVVVDTGPDSRLLDRCLADLGVRRISMLVLTHMHADHVRGLDAVLRRPIAAAVVTNLDDPAEEAGLVLGKLAKARVPVTRVAPGTTGSAGRLSWRFLAPVRPFAEESRPNNASIVLLVASGGLRLLLTGDVERPAQAELMRVLDADHDGVPDVGRIDVLKVAHHGSANQDPALFALVRPAVAVISVGAGNDYGHPAVSTLRLATEVAAQVARTDTDGDIAVVGGAHPGVVRRNARADPPGQQ